jgi:hypothetical protein
MPCKALWLCGAFLVWPRTHDCISIASGEGKRRSDPSSFPALYSRQRACEFVVETDRAGEAPMPFWSETVRQVVVE